LAEATRFRRFFLDLLRNGLCGLWGVLKKCFTTRWNSGSFVGSDFIMQPDLLHAQASVDWAESNLPLFKERLDAWLRKNVDVAIRKQPPNVPNNVVVIEAKESFPLAFQVEAGAYLNVIRSSLDILSSALTNRHCQALIDDAYFPIASSRAIFLTGKGYKGHKLIQALPAKERAIIESLKPYRGPDGNELLCALHDLDIVRKHARLLEAGIAPRTFMVSGWGDTIKAFTPVSTGWVSTGPDEAVIGLIAKDAAEKPHIKATPQVSFTETAYLPRREVITALHEFANFAKSIIKMFDYT
jgi:hypothetical protein